MIFQKVGFVLVIIFALILIMPLVWMIAGSFQHSDDLTRVPPRIISNDMGVFNYVKLMKYPLFKWALNSLIVSVCGAVLGCIINLLAGYAFAKKKFYGKEFIFTMFLITLIIPSQITLIPSFLIIKGLGIYNTLLAVILPCGMSGFAVFMLRRFIEKIPDEFFSMATIDGCNEFQKFIHILVPLSASAIVTILIMNFIGIWNNFLWQMIVLGREEIMTLPLGVSWVMHNEMMLRNNGLPSYGTMLAAATFSFIPVLLVFVFGQKYYMKNMFYNGEKG